MNSFDPRRYVEWNDIPHEQLANWSAVELIANIHHHLRQRITTASGLSDLLVSGVYGFTDAEQQQIVTDIHTYITAIREINGWLSLWIDARVDVNGLWISDTIGTIPPTPSEL